VSVLSVEPMMAKATRCGMRTDLRPQSRQPAESAAPPTVWPKDKRALRMTGALVPGHDPTQPPAHGAAVIKL
jgi:hypothetical protein